MGLKDVAELNKQMLKNEIRRSVAAYDKMGMNYDEIEECLVEVSELIEEDGVNDFIESDS